MHERKGAVRNGAQDKCRDTKNGQKKNILDRNNPKTTLKLMNHKIRGDSFLRNIIEERMEGTRQYRSVSHVGWTDHALCCYGDYFCLRRRAHTDFCSIGRSPLSSMRL